MWFNWTLLRLNFWEREGGGGGGGGGGRNEQNLERFTTLSRLIRKQDLDLHPHQTDVRAEMDVRRDSRSSSIWPNELLINANLVSRSSIISSIHSIRSFARFTGSSLNVSPLNQSAGSSSAVWSWSWIWNTSDPSYNGDRGREHEERTGSVRSVGRQRGGPAPDDRAAHHGE